MYGAIRALLPNWLGHLSTAARGQGLRGWRLGASTPFHFFPPVDKSPAPSPSVQSQWDPCTWSVSLWPGSFPCERSDRDREREYSAVSVVSHYRESQGFYSISPIMALHPPLLKSICFYLMPQLFPDALFFTLNTNLSLRLFFSPPSLLQAEWLLTRPLPPPPCWTCKLLLSRWL